MFVPALQEKGCTAYEYDILPQAAHPEGYQGAVSLVC
jgi:hypothetical protein